MTYTTTSFVANPEIFPSAFNVLVLRFMDTVASSCVILEPMPRDIWSSFLSRYITSGGRVSVSVPRGGLERFCIASRRGPAYSSLV